MEGLKVKNVQAGTKEKLGVVCTGYKDKKGKCTNTARFPKIIPYCSNCAGANFEDQVAKLFTVQGYKVRQNLTLAGTQHDFFAELEFGFVTTGILVECKWKFREDGKVDSEDVRKFYGSYILFNQQKTYGIAHHAYLVTSGIFAPEAIEVAENLGIKLFTYYDLIASLIKFDSYLESLIRQYENSPLNGHYIELRTDTGSLLTRETIQKLDNSNAVVVLGDYGAGKTSFCLKLCHALANGIKQGKSVPLPIYIQLKDYTKAINMDSLITNLLVNNCRIPNASIHTFKELLECIDIILIFDGFDEIARRVDYAVKFKVFNEICSYATDLTKIIVTCRPNFFNQRNEFERIFKNSPLHFEPTSVNVEFEEVQINDLNVDQIKRYVNSFKRELAENGLNHVEFIKILDNIHDLWDLAKRPVLLNVMLETIPRMGKSGKNEKINAATLYTRYTGFWLDREDRKGKTLIKSSEKIRFTQLLAKKMFITNNLTINHKELPDEVKHYFDINDPENIEHYSHDIRSCSFLNLDDIGNYKFIHKSFMEYFVAKEIAYEIKQLRNAKNELKVQIINELLGECLLNLEIGLFIRDLIDNEELTEFDLKSLNIEELYGLTDVAKKNLLSISIKVQSDINELLTGLKDFEGVDLSFVNLNNITLRGVNFSGAIFYKSVLKNVKLDYCNMVNTVFRKSILNHVELSECTCDTSDFSDSIIEDCSFDETIFAYSKVNNTIFRNCDFYRSDLTEIVYNSNTKLQNCTNIETTIGTPYTEAWK